jgi:two-component sensor histidine kinase
LRRVVLADVSPVKGALWAAVAVAVPTLLRLSIDARVTGSGFITYYPAVALAALFLGWRWGTAVAVVSTAVANKLFGAQSFWDLLTGPNALLLALFALSCAVLIVTGEMCRRLLRQLEAAQAREELLNQELMHRVKNMLATVNAMAVLTSRHCEPGGFAQAFSGRMRALDKANELLGAGRETHCEARTLVESATEPFRTDGNFELAGPRCDLPSDACVPLSLALHELCTNAAKHGALSVPEGTVELRWECSDDGLLTLDWRERDGPPVPAQRRAGMGTQLLRRQRGLKSVEVDFRPEGLTCRICIAGVYPSAAQAEA